MPFYLLIMLLFVIIIFWVMIPFVSKRNAKRQQERLETIARLKPDVEGAFAEISRYYGIGHYITESERLMLAKKYEALDKEVKSLLKSKALEESAEKEVFKRFHAAMTDTRAHKNANNGHFIEKELSRCSQYFNDTGRYIDLSLNDAILSPNSRILSPCPIIRSRNTWNTNLRSNQ